MKSFVRLIIGATEPSQGRFIAWCALFAFLAGGAKAVLHATEKTRWRDITASAVASVISGVIVGLLGLYAWGNDKQLLIAAISGLGGWLGPSLLDMLSAKAIRYVQDNDPRPPAPPAPPSVN